jgi:hypothetical protein
MAHPSRLRASLRFNAVRYVVLLLTLLGAWGLIRAAMWEGPPVALSTFMLALAGGLLAAAGKTAIDIFNWADAARQTTHVERINAVQRVFQRARELRSLALIDWRRIHTVIVDNLGGEQKQIRLFETHEETDKEAAALVKKAAAEELWIRSDGVDAVKRFQSAIAALDFKVFPTEADFLAVFNGLMDNLRRELAVAAVGMPLD